MLEKNVSNKKGKINLISGLSFFSNRKNRAGGKKPRNMPNKQNGKYINYALKEKPVK